MTRPREMLVADVVSQAGPCYLCRAAALYCDPDVREDDLEHVTSPVVDVDLGEELVGVLRCAVCSTCNGFVCWARRRR